MPWAIVVDNEAYGPYVSRVDTVEKARTFPEDAKARVVRMHSLSEELDNPAGAWFHGDAPEWN